MTTDAELFRELVEAERLATPGPWSSSGVTIADNGPCHTKVAITWRRSWKTGKGTEAGVRNATFIAAARNVLPILLNLLRERGLQPVDNKTIAREAAEAMDRAVMLQEGPGLVDRVAKRILATIEKAQAGQWISVKERMPENRQAVLITVPVMQGKKPDWVVREGWWDKRSGFFLAGVAIEETPKRIGYWRPLPPPPEVE